MPSLLHETLVEMFRHRPSLAAELLGAAFGVDLPRHEQVRVDSGDLPDITPTEYRADTVTVLTARDAPVLAVVVEVQGSRDGDKRWSWPVYLATLRARLRCPVVLLVVCTDTATAAWCATPIDLGHPGWMLVPLVLGPDQVPVITDLEVAGEVPELAVLSAIAHGADPTRRAVLDAVFAGLATVDQQHFTLYSDVVMKALPTAARGYLEALMASPIREYESEFVRRYVFQGRAEGEAKGEAKAVLAVLDARGLAVPEAVQARITGCTDLDQLDAWVRRAVTVESVDDLFG